MSNNNINILHLSDLHFDGNKTADVEIILEALWRDLSQSPPIDLILFSGDLVKIGDREQDFQAAKDTFIMPLLQKTELTPDRFFLAPGNHDVQRSQIDHIIETGLTHEMVSRDAVNSFLDGEIQNGFQRIERLDNFNSFKEQFGSRFRLNSNKLFSTFAIRKEPFKIGIACLNSCWRASGRGENGDQGRLIIGERQIDEALKDIADCHIKLALYHHSLEWLHECDHFITKQRIAKKFDVAFCGHLHKSNIEDLKFFDKDTVVVQGGALNKGRLFLNCYGIVSLNPENRDGKVSLRTYFDEREEFAEGVNLVKEGRFSFVFSSNESALTERLKKEREQGRKFFLKGIQDLDMQKYELAFKKIQKASQLLPDNLEVQLYYCIAFLSNKQILSIDISEMNEIVNLLEAVVEEGEKNRQHLARLLLGILWLDFYTKEDHNFRKEFFDQNTLILRNYRPNSEEKKCLRHLFLSDSAKIIFNLN